VAQSADAAFGAFFGIISLIPWTISQMPTARHVRKTKPTGTRGRQQARPEQIEPRPELFFGLVGAIGTNLDMVLEMLEDALSEVGYRCYPIKLSELLEHKRYNNEYERYDLRMKAGTQLRKKTGRGDAVALLGLGEIWDIRSEYRHPGERTLAAKKKRQLLPIPNSAFIFNQLKHPEEVASLRTIYGESFFLIAGYSPREQRVASLADRLAKSSSDMQSQSYRKNAETLIERDKNEAGEKLGQRVQDTFPEADVFINVSGRETVQREIQRFIELLFGYPYHTPTRDEFAMFQARAASLRSADLGRQVGAVITTVDGDIVSVGTNEVPKAGGGQYWPDSDPDRRDFQLGQDSNTAVKRTFLKDLLQQLKKNKWLARKRNDEFNALVNATFSNKKSFLSDAHFMSLIAYFRAVHAEMACIMDAAKRGVPTYSNTLVCTTFPCHECARHIVAAGIFRVVYIDPYPKSLASDLYPDSIVVDPASESSTHVAFQPFVGIAPRQYLRLFDCNKFDRKDNSGKVIKWRGKNAMPRITSNEEAYVYQEIRFSERIHSAESKSGVGKGGNDAKARKGAKTTGTRSRNSGGAARLDARNRKAAEKTAVRGRSASRSRKSKS
jgi:deoxycytidylate deaminase